MRKSKRLISFLCAASMMFSAASPLSAITAFAADENTFTVNVETSVTTSYVKPDDTFTISYSIADAEWTVVPEESGSGVSKTYFNSDYALRLLTVILEISETIDGSYTDAITLGDAWQENYFAKTLTNSDVFLAISAVNAGEVVTDQTLTETELITTVNGTQNAMFVVYDTENLVFVNVTVNEDAEDGAVIEISAGDCIYSVNIETGASRQISVTLPDTLTVDAAAPTISDGSVTLVDGESYEYDYMPAFVVDDTVSGVASVTVDGSAVAVTDDVASIPDSAGEDMAVVVTDNAGHTTEVTISINSAAASNVAALVADLVAMGDIDYTNIDNVEAAYATASAAYEKLSTTAKAGLSDEADDLADVLAAINTYRGNESGALTAAINAIEALSADITWADKADVENASGLVSTYVDTYGGDEADVTNYATLTAAEDVISDIQDLLDAAIEAIAALPAVDEVQYGDDTGAIKTAEDAAQAALDAGVTVAELTDYANIEARSSEYTTEITEVIAGYVVEIADLNTGKAVVYSDAETVATLEDAIADLLAERGVPTTAYSNYATIATAKADYETYITDVISEFDEYVAQLEELATDFNYADAKVVDTALTDGDYVAYLEAKRYDVSEAVETLISENTEKVAKIDASLASVQDDVDELEALLIAESTTVEERAEITALIGEVDELLAAGIDLDTILGTEKRVEVYEELAALVAEQVAAYTQLVADVNGLLSGVTVLYTMDSSIETLEDAEDALYKEYGLTLADYNSDAGKLLEAARTAIEEMVEDAKDLNTDMVALVAADDVTYANLTDADAITEAYEDLLDLGFTSAYFANYDSYYATVEAIADMVEAVADATAAFAAIDATTTWADKADIEAARAAYGTIDAYNLSEDEELAEGIDLSALEVAEDEIARIQGLLDDAEDAIELLVAALGEDDVQYTDADAIEAARAIVALALEAGVGEDEIADYDVLEAYETEYAEEITDAMAALNDRLDALSTDPADVTQDMYDEALAIEAAIAALTAERGTPAGADADSYPNYASIATVVENYATEITDPLAALSEALEAWTYEEDSIVYADKATIEDMADELAAYEEKGVDLEDVLSEEALAAYEAALAAVAAMDAEIAALAASNEELASEWTLDNDDAYTAAESDVDAIVAKYAMDEALSDEVIESMLSVSSITTAQYYQSAAVENFANLASLGESIYTNGATQTEVDAMTAIIESLQSEPYFLTEAQISANLADVVDEEAVNFYDVYQDAYDEIYNPVVTPSVTVTTTTTTTTTTLTEEDLFWHDIMYALNDASNDATITYSVGTYDLVPNYIWQRLWNTDRTLVINADEGQYVFTAASMPEGFDFDADHSLGEFSLSTSGSTSVYSPTTGDPAAGAEDVVVDSAVTTEPATTDTAVEDTVVEEDDVTVGDVVTDSAAVASLATNDTSVASIVLVVAALALVCGVALVVVYKRKEAEED